MHTIIENYLAKNDEYDIMRRSAALRLLQNIVGNLMTHTWIGRVSK